VPGVQPCPAATAGPHRRITPRGGGAVLEEAARVRTGRAEMPEPTHSVVVPTAGPRRPPSDPAPCPTAGRHAAPPAAAAPAAAVRLPFATHLSRKSGGTSLVSATWLTSYPHRPAGIQRRPENSLTVTRARPPSAPPDRRRTPPQAR